ncbi:hypothetical protein DCAR_0206859 [Daucus carota subsp. sativus]|uniref:F-box domain-containing protein n=1 Tax=Daucus carota subsp. sativus TaxID=79200 RepID=A0AAF1ALJ1_DAUCS|nr:hypothetical protein DCAR_0206859 [Daucus carota subsp. sativus]
MSNLPDDLWFQIFLHLPVKDLLASKCVCKSWLANISSRRFVTDHLRRSISSGEDNETLIVHHSVNRAQHGWGPFSLTHLTSGDVLEQLDSPYEALKVWRVAPMRPRCFNSADSTLQVSQMYLLTHMPVFAEEIIYFFESFCGKVLRLRVFENHHYPTCAAFMEFATIVISVSQPPADGVYSSASFPSYQGSLK